MVAAANSNGRVDIVVPGDQTTYRVDADGDNGSVSVVVDQSRRSDHIITVVRQRRGPLRYAEQARPVPARAGVGETPPGG